jgi:hypothetical protein
VYVCVFVCLCVYVCNDMSIRVEYCIVWKGVGKGRGGGCEG